MSDDRELRALVQQWALEHDLAPEVAEANQIASEWLSESPTAQAVIPVQRQSSTVGGTPAAFADIKYLKAMQRRMPGVPADLLTAAASWWQLVGDVREAEAWWDAGLSPLDQRALEYRAAGLAPSDLARRLGPMTVLQHLRRGSAPAWCVARLARQRAN